MLAHQRSPVVRSGRARRGGSQQDCTADVPKYRWVEDDSLASPYAMLQSKRDVGFRFDLMRLEQITASLRMRDCLQAPAHDTMLDERALTES